MWPRNARAVARPSSVNPEVAHRRARSVVLDGATLIASCAALGAAWIMFNDASHSSASASRITRVSNWQSYSDAGTRMGVGKSRVTIVEFADFACPYCKGIAPTLKAIREHHPDQVGVVFRNLIVHPVARAPARASVCAAAQGHFEQLHDSLFANPDSFETRSMTSFAIAAGVPDTATFAKCLRSHYPDAALVRDSLAARRLGATGTPTLLINDIKIVGNRPLAELEQLVAGELRPRAWYARLIPR
jgi:protein-disulfide isomerase